MQNLTSPSSGLSEGYGLEELSVSKSSRKVLFKTGVDKRDQFLGHQRCVVCGDRTVDCCHVIPQEKDNNTIDLRRLHWVPAASKTGEFDPCAGLLLCPNHREKYDRYVFFIRYVPQHRKYIFVNYSDAWELQPYHGKAIALDVADPYAPLPSLFVIHENRVRGHWPFAPINPDMPKDIIWQDWISSRGCLREPVGTDHPLFHREALAPDQSASLQPLSGLSTASSALAPLDDDMLGQILAATRGSLSWKTCEQENTTPRRWGTAEEDVTEHEQVPPVES
ncbi:hypothetical protein BD626DRAFT_396367 [Schizophyllum amplum]|uniref:HNH nuclease domain-containing protein n=1 Tax=Schizophyllum amplum TaxID=97359 RepID=A0A550CP53_9AGAR|nr:hypothetical protein BD626DRAFT_396367 [Auriculariopsis ampla]